MARAEPALAGEGAVLDDDPPYIESLGEHWGVLRADPALASHWADQFLPLVQHVMADRRMGAYAYSRSGTLCHSALFHASRFDDLLAVLALDPKPYGHDQQWAAKALAARGGVDGAVHLMEGLRSRHAPDRALSSVAEQLLLDAGRRRGLCTLRHPGHVGPHEDCHLSCHRKTLPPHRAEPNPRRLDRLDARRGGQVVRDREDLEAVRPGSCTGASFTRGSEDARARRARPTVSPKRSLDNETPGARRNG
jgi:hypothetical protein